MTRLIDADAIFPWYVEAFKGGVEPRIEPHDTRFSMLDIKMNLSNIPTIDAVPVIHGKWIPRYIKIAGRDFKQGMQCSVCTEPAFDVEGDAYLTDYCPWCGARMDEEDV